MGMHTIAAGQGGEIRFLDGRRTPIRAWDLAIELREETDAPTPHQRAEALLLNIAAMHELWGASALRTDLDAAPLDPPSLDWQVSEALAAFGQAAQQSADALAAFARHASAIESARALAARAAGGTITVGRITAGTIAYPAVRGDERAAQALAGVGEEAEARANCRAALEAKVGEALRMGRVSVVELGRRECALLGVSPLTPRLAAAGVALRVVCVAEDRALRPYDDGRD